jgi:hypothetical protein
VRIDSLVKTQAIQIVRQSYTVGEPDVRATQVLRPMAQKPWEPACIVRTGSRCSASQKHCSFWKHCEEEFGGRVRLS